MSDGKLKIQVDLDTTKAKQDYDQFGNELGNKPIKGPPVDTSNPKRQIKELSTEAQNMAKTSALALGATSIAFGGFALKSAADMGALNSQFAEVFGDLEGEATKSLGAIAKEANMLPEQVKGPFVEMAAFAKTTGMNTADALDLTSRATMAAADSSAFHNTSIKDVTESLKGYLKGNYANDAALGITSTETTRNAAANKLYGQSFKDLSEEQKQLTLLQMVEDGNKLSGALGQAAREGGEFEAVIAKMQQAIVNVAVAFGSPILEPFLNMVSKLTDGLISLAGKLENNPALVYAIVGAVTTLVSALGAVYVAANAAKWLGTLKAALFGTGSAMGLLTNPIFWVVAAIGTLITSFVYFYKSSETFRNAIDRMIAPLKKFVEAIKLTFFGSVFDKMTDLENILPKSFGKEFVQGLYEVFRGIMTFKETIRLTFAVIKGWFTDFASVGDSLGELQTILEDAFSPEFAQKFIVGLQNILANVSRFIAVFKGIAGIVSGSLSSLEDVADFFDMDPDDGWVRTTFALGEGFKNLFGIIKGSISNVITNIKEFGSALMTAFKTGDTGPLIESFKNIIPMIISLLMGGIPKLILVGMKLLTSLADGMGTTVPELIVMATNVITSLIEGFASALPMILEVGVGILTSIIEGIVTVLPTLIEIAINVITTLIETFVTLLPTIIETGISILMALIDGLISVLPVLIEAAITLLMALIQAFIDNLPKIIEAGVTLIEALIDGIVQVLPALIQAAITLAIALIQALIKHGPQILAAGIQLIKALISGALQMLGALVSAGGQLIGALLSKIGSFFGKMLSKGGELIMKLVTGISNKVSNAKNAVTNVLQGALSSVGDFFGRFRDAGANIVGMIADGISGAVGKVTGAISNITQKIRNFLPFSPAKEGALRDLHKLNFGGTISTGIYAAESKVKRAMSDLSDIMNSELLDGMPAISLDAAVNPNGRLVGAGTSGGGAVINNVTNTQPRQPQEIVLKIENVTNLDKRELAREIAAPVRVELDRIKTRSARSRGDRK